MHTVYMGRGKSSKGNDQFADVLGDRRGVRADQENMSSAPPPLAPPKKVKERIKGKAMKSLGNNAYLSATGQEIRNVHPQNPECEKYGCPIHSPTKHCMDDLPITTREGGLIERTCPHGVGHPDPDSASYFQRINPNSGMSIHGCDGCCSEEAREDRDNSS
jgi:hypothetical protein